MKIHPLMLIALALTGASLLNGCNLFGGLNSPSGDAQLLSAARASFDQGKFDDALKYYGQLSGSYSDVANSEGAMTILDQNGVGMSTYITAFGQSTSNVGGAITSMANMLINQNPGQKLRLNIFGAYSKISQISDPGLRGLIRFLTSVGLMSEIFAEAATGGQLHRTDIATSASCSSSTPTLTCSPACDGSASVIADGGSGNTDPNSYAASDFTGSPNLFMIDATIKAINLALGATELSGSGNFSTASINIGITQTDSAFAESVPSCFRYALIHNGIGN